MAQKSANLKSNKTASSTNSSALLDIIVDSIHDIKGKNVLKLDLTKLDDAPTNYFVICEGDSSTQIKSISLNINKRVKKELGLTPSRIEGMQDSKWSLVDYFDVVVHVFYPETRRYYDLEDLWSDAIITEYEDVL